MSSHLCLGRGLHCLCVLGAGLCQLCLSSARPGLCLQGGVLGLSTEQAHLVVVTELVCGWREGVREGREVGGCRLSGNERR